jgi:hypothetical protein
MTRFILHCPPHVVESALDFGLKAGGASGSPKAFAAGFASLDAELIHAALARDQARRQKR